MDETPLIDTRQATYANFGLFIALGAALMTKIYRNCGCAGLKCCKIAASASHALASRLADGAMFQCKITILRIGASAPSLPS
jgi:hypothetical protein